MGDWSEELGFILRKLGKTAESAVGAIGAAFDDDPHEVVCYRGYGNSAKAWVYGRVIQKRKFGASADSDSTFRNLLNTYRRVDSDPVSFAEGKIEYEAVVQPMKADDEGFFGGWVELTVPLSDEKEWREYTVAVDPEASGANPIKGMGEVLNPTASARYGVISDIDDTVIQSRVTSFIQAARTVMLGNARTRLPFPGVAAFYRALSDGAEGSDKNPIFYVSSSPWNIYDVIAEFMDLQNLPKGPILLRDWDIGPGALSSRRHFDHKGVATRNILNLYPHLPFFLIGDSSQHDPEIYHQIVAEFPSRINAIYIRDVTGSPERSSSVNKLAEETLAAHSTLVLSDDTIGAARHAAEHGWISDKALPGIGDDKRADEGTEGSKVAAPEGGKPGLAQAPTVIGIASGVNRAGVLPQSVQAPLAHSVSRSQTRGPRRDSPSE